MAFEKKVPVWQAEGTEPPESLKKSGFTPGYKPPADYFNWFWHAVCEALLELQEKSADGSGLEEMLSSVEAHLSNKSNPHNVTAEQVGAVKSSEFNNHTNNKSNPHNVTAEQSGAVSKSGDTMTGDLLVSKNGTASVRVVNTSTSRRGTFQLDGDSAYVLNGDLDSTEYFGISIDNTSGRLDDKLRFINKTAADTRATIYKVFGTHNVTKGTSALTAGSSALTNDCIYLQYE